MTKTFKTGWLRWVCSINIILGMLLAVLECFCVFAYFRWNHFASRFSQRNAPVAWTLFVHLYFDFCLFSFCSWLSSIFPLSSCDECHITPSFKKKHRYFSLGLLDRTL